jgi:hypothetical protein
MVGDHLTMDGIVNPWVGGENRFPIPSSEGVY